jgi:hypothetical protein
MSEHLTLKPIRSELQYRGNYRDNAFELLITPVLLYRSLLKHLGQFGAALQSIKWEAHNVADSHVSCGLVEMNVLIRVRIDRMEIEFWRLQEIGADVANRIMLATWAAVREANNSVEIASHVVDTIVVAKIQGETCSALMNRYVKTPDALGIVDLGIAFYARPVQKNEGWTNVILERVFKQDDQVQLKMVMGIDSGAVALDALAGHVDFLMTTTLDKLGLRLGRDDQK